jgi:predicted DNA binding CopG/RHH family protein
MATGQNVNMRIPDELLEHIDHNATQAGLSRTQYILSYLPENYHSNGETKQRSTADNAR